MITTARRIPKFSDKLRAALDGAGLPKRVETHVDGSATRLDPSVILTYWYGMDSYSTVIIHTDAHDRGWLDARVVVNAALDKCKRGAQDPRYTDVTRVAFREFADVLTAWLA